MERAIKPYEQVEAMLGGASSAWEKLVGHIRFYYVMDEKCIMTANGSGLTYAMNHGLMTSSFESRSFDK